MAFYVQRTRRRWQMGQTGGGGGGSPEINVTGNGNNISNGDATPSVGDNTDFGSSSVGTPVPKVFVIENLGTADLAGILVSVPSGFTLTIPPAASIPSLGNSSFTVTADAASKAVFSGNISITSNDADENPYVFAITFEALQAEMRVLGNGVDIADGDATPSVGDDTDFGSGSVGVPVSHVFTIENTGTENLSVTTPITVPAGFTCTVQPANTVVPAGSTTFTVRADAGSGGTFSGDVSIANSDPNENPYNFAITFTAVAAAEINVKGNGVNIPNGDLVPSLTDHTDFGDVPIGTTFTRTFTIENTGGANLTGVIVTVPSGYTLTVAPSATIVGGGSSTFDVQFNGTFSAAGYGGNISIANSDSDENPYVFAIVADLWALLATFDSAKTAELGTLTYNEVDGAFTQGSPVASKLNFPAQATPTYGDLSVRSQLISMLDDVAMIAAMTINFSTRNQSIFGWYPTTLIDSGARLGDFFTTEAMPIVAGSNLSQGLSINTATDYPLAVVARDIDSDANAEEYHALVKISGYWHRLWVRQGQNDASMYAAFTNQLSVGSIDNFNVKPMPTNDHNPSVDLVGSQSAGQTWTLPDGDFFKQFTLTTRPSAGSVNIYFRKKGASDYWRHDIASTGAQTLYEVVAGAANSRGSGGTAVNGSVITVIAQAQNIRLYVGTVISVTYTSSFNFMRETAAELNSLGTGGVVSDIKIWKRLERNESGLGAEVVVNGTFAVDANWTKGTGWTISGGAAHKAAGSAANLTAAVAPLTVNTYYELTFTVSNYSAGTLSPTLGSGALAPVSANGTYTYRGVANTTALLFAADSSFVGDIDDVSCKPIQFVASSLAPIIDGVVNG